MMPWISSFQTAAKADSIVTLLYVPTSAYPWRVDILKNRGSQESIHVFKSYHEALVLLGSIMGDAR